MHRQRSLKTILETPQDRCNETRPDLVSCPTMPDKGKIVTVAAAQLPARPLAEASQGLAEIAEAVAAARKAGAALVVLPECCYPCYWLGSKEAYFDAAILRGRDIENYLADLARRHDIHIVAGLIQERAGRLYDAAVLFDRAGRVLGSHCKTFLWDREHDWYEPGDAVRPLESQLGRIGLIVCAEGRAPEVIASHVAQGAGLIAMPTAWVNAAAQAGQYYNPQPDFIIPARATEFGLPFVCANKFGEENAQARFCGMSLIVAGDGAVPAKAPPDAPGLLVEQVRITPRALELSPSSVKRLLERTAPLRPRADAKPLRIALLAGKMLHHLPESRMQELFASLRQRGAEIALTALDDPAGSQDARKAAAQFGVQLLGPPSEARTAQLASATVGYLPAPQARSFAPARAMALDGAALLCIFGTVEDLCLLRVRAVENRVFVAAVSADEALAIDPAGNVLARSAAASDEPMVVDLDLAQAANKQVAPRTDIWTERRPAAYRL